jgi:hypothetical protein
MPMEHYQIMPGAGVHMFRKADVDVHMKTVSSTYIFLVAQYCWVCSSLWEHGV